MSKQFSKKDIWRLQKDTWKLNYIMIVLWGVKYGNYRLLNYANLFILKKLCLHFPLPVTLPYLSISNSLSLQLSSDSNRLRRL